MRKLAALIILALLLTACGAEFRVEVDGTMHAVRIFPPASTTPGAPPTTATDTPPPASATGTPAWVTPTVEVLPTGTAINTPVATPPRPVCEVGIAASTLNVRPAPGDFSRIITQVHNPARYPVLDVQWVGNDEWALISVGWVAVVYQGVTYASYPDVDLCLEIRFPPPPLVVGIRTVPGAGDFESMYPILQSKGLGYGVSPYGALSYCVSALQQDGTCVLRTGSPDCPPCSVLDDPRACARDFMQNASSAALVLAGAQNAYIEPTNECSGTPATAQSMAWWSEFYLEYIEQAAARGWPPLAIPGFPPGHGDAALFNAWHPMLEKLRDNGGLFSMHAYTFNSRADLCPFDEWESYRHVHNHALMLAAGYEIPIAITEAARWSGNAPVSVDDFVCWIEANRNYDWLHSVWLWVGGAHPVWPLANLDPYYEIIANGLQ